MDPKTTTENTARTGVREVRLELHAQAVDLVDRKNVVIEISKAAAVAELRTELGRQVPELAELVVVSVFATETAYLRDADLVPVGAALHLIPPVSGG